MRLFQNSGIYPGYLPRLKKITQGCIDFNQVKSKFLDDRYGACHFLQPVYDINSSAFFTNGDDESLQRMWANEHGMSKSATLEEILLAQIEEHRTEVFYNLDPMRYNSTFVRKLPKSVKHSIAWRAAPSPGADFGAYDSVVCNFPSILESYRKQGWRAEYFSPAHDPEMDVYAENTERPIDVLFVGGYSRHHRQRALILEAVAQLKDRFKVVYCLDRSRLTRLAESPIGYVAPLAAHRRPFDIRAVSHEPVFGRDLYSMLSKAKIVLNGAVDMAGHERGNMRCFETMGCGALMVSDDGVYPEGMVDGKSMLNYKSSSEAVSLICEILFEPNKRSAIAEAGLALMRNHFGKKAQWECFMKLVASL